MKRAEDLPRTALLAGVTGLVGRALLPLLLRCPACASVVVLTRRPLDGVGAAPGLQIRVVDFARLPEDLPHIDDAYIALGTTIKVAGSEAAFRQVDFDFVLNTARAARAAGASRLAVVSALGADPRSRVFYNRVKGEMEAAVAQLGFESLTLVRPSLLLGDREALGQPTRSGEVWASRLLAPVMGWVPAGIRPIRAGTVAAAMLSASMEGRAGTQILSSAQMQRKAARGEVS